MGYPIEAIQETVDYGSVAQEREIWALQFINGNES